MKIKPLGVRVFHNPLIKWSIKQKQTKNATQQLIDLTVML